MKPNKLIVLFGCAVLAACGGGGETQTAGIDAGGEPAPNATVVSKGRISGFGSVIVNGVRFETSGATIVIDGKPGTEANLSVGQIVTITGTISEDGTSGTANNIAFDDDVQGPISALDASTGTLVVLGQTVNVTGDTSFDDDISPRSIDGLNIGDIVEVSGYVRADGTINATRIELESPDDDFEVTGMVSNLDAATFTFNINDLTVDYSAANLGDFPNGAPENGQRVEAKGDTLGAAGELLATEVELEDDAFGDIDEVELEGLITRFDSATDFDVAGIPVTTNGSTEFEGGTIANLALNVRIEVEGSIDSAGVLVAEEIDFEEDGVLRVTSHVEDVQGDQLTLLGITITTSAKTEYEDDSSLRLRNFGIDDISVGDYLEVRGFDSAGNFIATRVERDNDDTDIELQGFVATVNDPDFTILGVTIVTNINTEFQDVDDVPISAADFFAQADGKLVSVEGTLSNGQLIAEEVELED
ncbi:MAG TPA: DUF5666 domain-containing protein [Woeseiaceae bacterium]|nr:DUF5666 domain-containing protein [Woeseiaceae bacterium]